MSPRLSIIRDDNPFVRKALMALAQQYQPGVMHSVHGVKGPLLKSMEGAGLIRSGKAGRRLIWQITREGLEALKRMGALGVEL